MRTRLIRPRIRLLPFKPYLPILLTGCITYVLFLRFAVFSSSSLHSESPMPPLHRFFSPPLIRIKRTLSGDGNDKDGDVINNLYHHQKVLEEGNLYAIDVVDLVDPFIGTTNGGHVFPGATLPFGMVKIGMDTDAPGNQAGYDADPKFKVTGFSQLHNSGTGGWTPLSNFKLFPISGCPKYRASEINVMDATTEVDREGNQVVCDSSITGRKVLRRIDFDAPLTSSFSDVPNMNRTMDRATPGYFSSRLENDVRVELTATRRIGIHRYTFPRKSVTEEWVNTRNVSDPVTMFRFRPPQTGNMAYGWRTPSALEKPPQSVGVDTTPRILIDLTNDGQSSGYQLAIDIDKRTGRVSGGGKYKTSFGMGDYSAFFCMTFHLDAPGSPQIIPTSSAVYVGQNYYTTATDLKGAAGQNYGQKGAVFGFFEDEEMLMDEEDDEMDADGGEKVIVARIAISMISWRQACRTLKEEAPMGLPPPSPLSPSSLSSPVRPPSPATPSQNQAVAVTFDSVRRAARMEWEKYLQTIEVDLTGPLELEHARLFYSSFYRTGIAPGDFSGENPGWYSEDANGEEIPYFDSLYCNWDTYRTYFPLLSLIHPELFARVVRSFIDVQQHEGWLPECRDAGVQQWVQGGSSGDAILAEFYVKFEKHAEALGVDKEDLYAAMVADAEIESPNWDLAGRQANVWKELGYLPVQNYTLSGGMPTRQVSRTLEYAFDDFSISQVARLLGKMEDFKKYSERSRGFELVWNKETEILDDKDKPVEGIKGFMQPKTQNGTFVYTDPRHCTPHDPWHSTCYLDGMNIDGFYEGGPIVYSQYVPHDTAKLIELQGGDEAFMHRLNYIFDNGYFDSTNEPSQQMPFMYHYSDRPGLSTERSRQAITESYNTSVNGLPGNDDSGAMGSYVMMNMLGLYPLPATRQWLISSPFFKSVKIYNQYFKTTTTINAIGFEGNPDFPHGEFPKDKKIYVKSVKIDGKPWHSNCFVGWEVFEKGSVIDLELTDDRTISCGNGFDSIPPSLSTGGYS